MTPQQRKDVLSLASSLSVDVKEEGHDLFVWYSPHVEQVSLHLYMGGWLGKSEPTLIRHVDLRANHSDAVNVLVEILSIMQKEIEDE